MYSETTETNPLGAKIGFALDDITGRWKSREGAPDIRVYKSSERKNDSFFMEFAFKTGEIFRCLVKKHQGIRYVNLYGVMGLSYNTDSDVLQLSAYGKYYRVGD
ncbi:MAG: hypothetical protein A2W90_18305 [Bacteroidetes bacterium GWF2_42_66]|nr:MAG: hypothetical protein A2W92_11610 [Bacteroidetes bacterium GWA2_42_15]OFX98250.1 MAG: hypothetical protein A2W89_09795 [Bacteroidetes bacterium GWE2_42_39]OFY42631.1 MAG: hypothetical protein A2W90_18305 [Bacteroidetes bacterium GWF2_42_66]